MLRLKGLGKHCHELRILKILCEHDGTFCSQNCLEFFVFMVLMSNAYDCTTLHSSLSASVYFGRKKKRCLEVEAIISLDRCM